MHKMSQIPHPLRPMSPSLFDLATVTTASSYQRQMLSLLVVMIQYVCNGWRRFVRQYGATVASDWLISDICEFRVRELMTSKGSDQHPK